MGYAAQQAYIMNHTATFVWDMELDGIYYVTHNIGKIPKVNNAELQELLLIPTLEARLAYLESIKS